MTVIAPFRTAPLPRIVFGAGTLVTVTAEVRAYGGRVLLVTGAKSFRQSAAFDRLMADFSAAGVMAAVIAIPGEPSPEMVDDAVAAHKGGAFDVVLGIGGGSALDAAKAIAGLLRSGHSVMDHLEGVGPERAYEGPAVPFIAVPTTAGTGSEATKNAVLSRHGPDGFKKSFRDDKLMAQLAIVDPDLIKTCPASVIAANGMDAFTQLLESYVSTKANPISDALAWSGLRSFLDGFWAAYDGGDDERAQRGRAQLAYASLLSGICLAQTGLGSVHGLASPLGAFFPIPHGVVCGTLVAEATDINITALQNRDVSNAALAKYAAVGGLFDGDDGLVALVAGLRDWVDRLDLPRLSTFTMTAADIPRVVANSRGSSMKTNPLVLDDLEIADILTRRL